VLVVAGPGLAKTSEFWPTVRSSTGYTARVAPGIQYSRYVLRTSSGPLSIHHLRLDMGNPEVHLGVALAHNQLISGDETVSSMVRRSGAIAGVNGDYFDIGDSGMPLNILVREGRLLRSPSGRSALAVGTDGRARIARYTWHGSILLPTTRATHWIAGFNTGTIPEGLTVLSTVRGYGAPPPDPKTRQTVVEVTPAEASPDQTVPGVAADVALPPSHDGVPLYKVKQVWSQQAYYAPFPRGTLLLVGRGRAADWLLQNMAAETLVQVNLATDPDWRSVEFVIGGGPVLVQNGQLIDDPHSPVPGERFRRNPVSAIGISQDARTLLLVSVDGRQPRLSVGLTQPQLATYLRRLGAYQAMQFDSGGSVTMAVRLPGRSGPVVVNSPSDGHERPVANALLVFRAPLGTSVRNSPRQSLGCGVGCPKD
jgi:phosphodiester glycosidase